MTCTTCKTQNTLTPTRVSLAHTSELGPARGPLRRLPLGPYSIKAPGSNSLAVQSRSIERHTFISSGGGCSARQVAQARPRRRCLTGQSSTSAIQDARGEHARRRRRPREVEALLVKRQRDQSRPFVRWLGFDAPHDTWEDEANRLDPSLVSKFHVPVSFLAGGTGRQATHPGHARAQKLLEAPSADSWHELLRSCSGTRTPTRVRSC